MPPEFLTSGQYDPRDETVWRLGIITYYLLTGCRPYKDPQEAVLRPNSEPTHLKHFSTGTLKQGAVHADHLKVSAAGADIWNANGYLQFTKNLLFLEARDLVKRMLSTNPHERARLKDVLKHSW